MKRLGAVASVLFLAACAGEPFVDRAETILIGKREDTIRKTGTFAICHAGQDEQTMAEVQALAREQCAEYGFEPLVVFSQRFQCRLMVPHRTTFRCVDFKMVNEDGIPINPFNAASVKKWRAAGTAGDAGGQSPPSPSAPPTPFAPHAAPSVAPSGDDFLFTPGGWGQAFDENWPVGTGSAPAPR